MTLSATITNAPAGAPSYVWKMSFGGDYWLTVSTAATASYLTSAAETVSFQVTVSYGSGESATSNAVSVAFVAATETRQAPAQQEEEQEQESEQEAETEAEKPAKPTGLSVTTVAGWLGALVDWDDVEGADDYLVRWRPAGPDQQLNDGLEPTSSNQAITVDEDGEYVVRVQACNEAGCGGVVAERFTVAPLPPGPPENFTLTAADSGFEVTASWDAHDEATSYQLAWVSLEGTGLAGGSQELTETSATVEGRRVRRVAVSSCRPVTTAAAARRWSRRWTLGTPPPRPVRSRGQQPRTSTSLPSAALPASPARASATSTTPTSSRPVPTATG